MISLTESLVNEATGTQWEVFKSLTIPVTVAKFTAPDKPYLWIYSEGNSMSFVTLKDIEDSFVDNGLDDEFNEVRKLNIGEAWCTDGLNIYVRLR